jgi:hypothetical protein
VDQAFHSFDCNRVPAIENTRQQPIMKVRLFYVVTAVLEGGAGLCLLIVPTLAIEILLGVEHPAREAAFIARIAGAALFAVGVACTLQLEEEGSRRNGLLIAMLVYNSGAAILLAYAGWFLEMVGILLWPGAVLHSCLAIWNLGCVIGNSATTAREQT